MKLYKIIHNKNLELFTKEIQEHLQNGWNLEGSLVILNHNTQLNYNTQTDIIKSIIEQKNAYLEYFREITKTIYEKPKPTKSSSNYPH